MEPPSRPLALRPVQRPLFAEAAKVVDFQDYAPVSLGPRPKPAAKAAVESDLPLRRRAANPRIGVQGDLELLPPAPNGPRKLGTTAEAAIYCDLPVAPRLLRAVAAAIDWSMVLLGYGLLLLIYHALGGGFPLNRTGQAALAGGLPLVAFTYGLMWALAGTESYGMRCAGLRIVNFDGFPPESRPRIMRFAGSCMSILGCGLGLVWALGDEESLTWQDHMSHTFPTPTGLEDRVFRRR